MDLIRAKTAELFLIYAEQDENFFKKTIAISKIYVIITKVRYEIRPYQPGS
jgi:hypothetical protein